MDNDDNNCGPIGDCPDVCPAGDDSSCLEGV
jgi:hypothetical protein